MPVVEDYWDSPYAEALSLIASSNSQRPSIFVVLTRPLIVANGCRIRSKGPRCEKDKGVRRETKEGISPQLGLPNSSQHSLPVQRQASNTCPSEHDIVHQAPTKSSFPA